MRMERVGNLRDIQRYTTQCTLMKKLESKHLLHVHSGAILAFLGECEYGLVDWGTAKIL